MTRYTYKFEADWEGTHEEGVSEMMYPEIIDVFNNKGLNPTEITVVTDLGIRITWRREAKDEHP